MMTFETKLILLTFRKNLLIILVKSKHLYLVFTPLIHFYWSDSNLIMKFSSFLSSVREVCYMCEMNEIHNS